MTPEGFATFIAVTFILLLMPLMMVLGTPVFWFLLPFLMGTLWMAWVALRRNNADARLTETLNVWSDRLELIRQNPRGDCQRWEANPYWVSLRLRDDSGPVPKYLTLKGNGREVELGAFLSPEERAKLYEDLDRLLRRLPAKA